MNKRFLSYIILAISLLSLPAFSQTESPAESDSTLLGLPGDYLDLIAVLDLFQKSPTIEEFEKSLNLEETGINNMDLNLDDKVDFIKVVTEQDGEDFTFILQVDVSEDEIQDVAVILVSRDENEKVIMQIVGDKDLYGENFVVEPAPPAPAVTANPAYAGPDQVESTPATTTVVVVESAPIVQYVYSPVYVPYYPPYHYAVYPPYFAAFTVVAVGVYRHNHYHHHHGYHGGYHGGRHGNTVVVHNHNTYNNYNNSRHSSNTVNHNKANGNYNNNRSSASTRPSTTPSASQGRGGSSSAARPSTTPSASQSRGSSSSAARPSASPSTRQSRPSSSPSARPSSSPSRSMSSSPSRSTGSSPSRGGGGRRR